MQPDVRRDEGVRAVLAVLVLHQVRRKAPSSVMMAVAGARHGDAGLASPSAGEHQRRVTLSRQ